MPLLNFNHKPKNELEEGGRKSAGVTPEQLQKEPVRACPSCRKEVEISKIRGNFHCCPRCGYHFRMSARQRIRFITDRNSFSELFEDLTPEDFLDFPGYEKKLRATEKTSGEKESVVCGTARIGGFDCGLFVMDPNFMMGSMGTVTGEKITRRFEYAVEHRLPVIGYTVSGGARMQEGILSLMQMAKTSAAVQRHSDAGLLYITILTDPTTGGVTASFAMEGDIILAEPGATVGFAGARVIEQTTRKKLPFGFQKSEFLLEHGFVDRIVPRFQQKETLKMLLGIHEG